MRIPPLLAVAAILLSLGSPARAGEKLTVLLDWFVNPDHAALILAQERGLFEKAGLEVELIPPADPSAPPRLVAAGQADLAVSYQPQLHVHVHEGLALTRVGTLVETPLNALVALEGGSVREIADLRGKKVGFSVGGFEDVALSAMLETQGVRLDEVELININFALSASLISGRVDAVIGAFRNFELNQLALEGYESVAFYPEENGVPAYDELILVARSDSVNDPRISAFLEAVEEATLWLTNHPQEAWEIFASSAPELGNELNRLAWRDTLPRLAKRPAALDSRRYERFASFMERAGMIDEVPPLASYAVEVR